MWKNLLHRLAGFTNFLGFFTVVGGLLALATSALTNEPWQPTTSELPHFQFYTAKHETGLLTIGWLMAGYLLPVTFSFNL